MQHPAVDVWHNKGIPVYEVDLVETSQSEVGAPGGNSGMVFKKFIVKTRVDYLGNGGKPPVPEGTPATTKSGT